MKTCRVIVATHRFRESHGRPSIINPSKVMGCENRNGVAPALLIRLCRCRERLVEGPGGAAGTDTLDPVGAL